MPGFVIDVASFRAGTVALEMKFSSVPHQSNPLVRQSCLFLALMAILRTNQSCED